MNVKITGKRPEIDKTLDYLSLYFSITCVKYVNDFSENIVCFATLVHLDKKKEVTS